MDTQTRFGLEWTASIARYGPRFKLHRRLFHQVFHAKAALTYRHKQLQSAYEMLTQLLDDPTRYDAHFTTCVLILLVTPRGDLHDVVFMQLMHRFSAAVVMAVTYGYGMKGRETFVTSMQRAADIFLRVASPEISAVCTAFPFRGCLPSDLIPLNPLLTHAWCSQGVSRVVSWNGLQVRSC